MPMLEVSDSVFQRIQRWAVPLVDTMDSALTRILDAADGNQARTVTLPPAVSGPLPPTRLIGAQVPNTKRARTLHVLLRKGLLAPGTKLVIVPDRFSGHQLPDMSDPRFHCRIGPTPRTRQNVVWDFDGRAYSLSTLTEKLREEHATGFSQGALNGYWHWALESQPDKSLWDLAEEVGR